jgi:hypothetical protein
VRAIVLAAGVLCLLVGVAMIVLPGPGLLVTLAGLAALALEVDWAERLLERSLTRSRRLRLLLLRSQRLLIAFAIADTLMLAGIIAAIVCFKLPLLP